MCSLGDKVLNQTFQATIIGTYLWTVPAYTGKPLKLVIVVFLCLKEADILKVNYHYDSPYLIWLILNRLQKRYCRIIIFNSISLYFLYYKLRVSINNIDNWEQARLKMKINR